MIRFKALSMTLALALLMAVTVSGAALAKGGGGGGLKETTLSATDAGNSISATGSALAQKRADGVQDFKVTMRARGVNGKTFKVFVTNSAFPAKRFHAGDFKVTLGSGALEIDNDGAATLPRGVRPVLGVQQVVVKNAAGKTVMKGSF